MNKIDTTSWKKYKLTDLFDIILPIGDIQAQKMNNGVFPLVSSGKNNNGICKYIDRTSKSNLIQANSITVDMFGKAFFHDYEYYCVAHGRINILIPKFSINKYTGLYIMRVIESITIPKYEFLDMCSQGALKKEIIKLPVNNKEAPDWEYMESYMKNIMQESENNIKKLNNIHNSKKTIDILGWREFPLGGDNGLFRIVKGTRLTKANMKDGNINFIGSSSVNNGITNHISNLEHIHPANLITVSYNGSIGEAFYQEKPFWASDDVNVFYPNFKQSFEIAMFLIPLIRKIGQKYKFVDKWKLEDMCNDKITLPINGNGEPDWEYMENYMKNIMNDTKAKLNILKTAI